MPSFQDSALLVFLALILFGPKKLPELARQFGKLMAEFRRASNEFRMQMEDELRAADQAEQKKKIEAMQAAAPVAPLLIETPTTDGTPAVNETPAINETPAVADGSENTIAQPAAAEPSVASDNHSENPVTPEPSEPSAAQPLPIATSGELNLMPPSTGLPVSNATLTPVLDAIPHTPDPETIPTGIEASEASHHG
jgi:sec-independent protein translocase protein TatB